MAEIIITDKLDTEGKVVGKLAMVTTETTTSKTVTLSQDEWIRMKEKLESLIAPLQEELNKVQEVLDKF